jgi:hypothetical protein
MILLSPPGEGNQLAFFIAIHTKIIELVLE